MRRRKRFGRVQRRIRRFITLFRAVARHDFVVLHPAGGYGAAVRYDRCRHPLPSGPCFRRNSLREVKLVCLLLGRPVVRWPALAELIDGQMEPGPFPSCRRKLALAMAHLLRLQPRRFGKKWGLEKRGPGLSRVLFRRWCLRHVGHADFLVAGRGAAAAIYYRPWQNVPRVLAMGEGTEGNCIRALAMEHGIPLVEDDFCMGFLLERAQPCEPVPEPCWSELISLMSGLARAHDSLLVRWGFDRKEECEGEEWKG